jgi:hypothetical protein
MKRMQNSDYRIRIASTILFLVGIAACNPFAPGLDDTLSGGSALVGDPKTIDGVFQNIKFAYTFRDTVIYGRLLNAEYVYVFRDYERGVDVNWGRDEDLRITNSLFQNVQRLDLVWNQIISISEDSMSTSAIVNRNFNLTVAFNPSDIERIDGYVSLALARTQPTEPWRIVRWRDESNF